MGQPSTIYKSSKLNYVWNYLSLTLDNFKAKLLGYRSYTALLIQTGIDAPVAIVLENTLGATITWTYNGVGEYYGELSSGTFNPVRTFTTSNSSFYSSPYYSFLTILSGDSTKVILGTFDSSNATELNGEICIEIRIYK